ncbi:biotin/lipoyl-binding protein [Salinispirillum sp. LH 10-3-1]|uniref:Biotin/lipoyl-binding protein n=1 Tax=Salinispirillum sp. LH 10-3-1 TaxID=2952525 RepID=A0AB38YDB8_9GAMM
MKRRLIRIGVALLLPLSAIIVTVLLVGNNNGVAPEEEVERLLQVVVLPVSSGAHAPRAEWTGRVVARQRVELTAPVAADVQRVLVNEGGWVAAGDPLIELDTQSPRWDLAQIEADLRDFDASILMARNQHAADRDMLEYDADVVAQAETVLAREMGLLQRGITTEAAVEQARMNLTQARQALRQRQLAIDNHSASLASLEAQRTRLNIALARQQDLLARAAPKAPFAARVGHVNAVEGQLIQAGQPLVSLYSPDSLAWRVILPNGVPDSLQAAIGGELRPIVQSSDTIAEGEVGRYAWFSLPPHTQWAPGETRSAKVYWPAIEGTMLIPTSALYSGNRVFLVNEEQRLSSVVVTVLGVNDSSGEEQWLVDAHGLPADGRILVSRLANIIPGMRVEVTQTLPVPGGEANVVF